MPCDPPCTVVRFRSSDHDQVSINIPPDCIFTSADVDVVKDQAIQMVKKMVDTTVDSCPDGCECDFDGAIERDENLVRTRRDLVQRVFVPSREAASGAACQLRVDIVYTLKKYRVQGECMPKRVAALQLKFPAAGLATSLFAPVDLEPGSVIISFGEVRKLEEVAPISTPDIPGTGNV